MARQAAETTWFERHAASGMVRLTEPPTGLRSTPRSTTGGTTPSSSTAPSPSSSARNYKRRWNVEPWDAQLARALRTWLLDRLEALALWPEPELASCARLADRVRLDAEFLRVAELLAIRPDLDLIRLVTALVRAESVPSLPHQRYRGSGRRKRRNWEKRWDLQRREDAIDGEVSALTDRPQGRPPVHTGGKRRPRAGAQGEGNRPHHRPR